MTNKANFNGLIRATRTGGIVLRKILRLIMSSSGKYTMKRMDIGHGEDMKGRMYMTLILYRRLQLHD